MFSNKRVLVLGAARSGVAAAKLLRYLNAAVVLNEYSKIDDFDEYQTLVDLGVEVVAGEHPKALFEEPFDFVIKNPGIKYTLWFVERLMARNIPIYTEIELAYQVSKPQHYVAITGTNGKTTTATLTYEIIKKQHPNKTHIAGNIGIPLCELVLKYDLLNQENHYIVLEMSNFQLLNIKMFKPEIATIINLAPDHLDYMKSVEEYYQSKTNIYLNQDFKDSFIVNNDDSLVKHYLKLIPPKSNQIVFSLKDRTKDYYLKDNKIKYREITILDVRDLKVVGKHNIQNCVIAIAITNKLGIDLENIQEVVTKFIGVAHRIEFVREFNGISYYNDSKATNIDATLTALKAFDKPLILLVGGYEKNLDVTPLKDYLKSVKQIIGYGVAGERLVNDLVSDDKSKLVVNTMDEALKLASGLAVSGDIVLLSPTTSSYDQFSNFEERGEYFKKIVNSLNNNN